ncbi:hypothetical protein IFM46972_03563 [Aspergillus udagawae]|uniref:Uncharacterized protein n=1 Tax=Aspergillus udagawae TaxID=91492 RepID=A0A8H3RNZ8_9EURO|nr:hypothetical protein IFM46972_03563 [Aspergillus udagawae]
MDTNQVVTRLALVPKQASSLSPRHVEDDPTWLLLSRLVAGNHQVDIIHLIYHRCILAVGIPLLKPRQPHTLHPLISPHITHRQPQRPQHGRNPIIRIRNHTHKHALKRPKPATPALNRPYRRKKWRHVVEKRIALATREAVQKMRHQRSGHGDVLVDCAAAPLSP